MADEDRDQLTDALLRKYAPDSYRSPARTAVETPQPIDPSAANVGPLSLSARWSRDTRPFPGLNDALNAPLDHLSEFSPEAAGLLGFLSRRPTALSAEWPTQAAVRIRGEVYPGITHFDALRRSVPGATERDLWEKELDEAFRAHHGFDWTRGHTNIEDGFLTNLGRYVDRQEATTLANAAGRPRSWWSKMFGRAYDSFDLPRSERN